MKIDLPTGGKPPKKKPKNDRVRWRKRGEFIAAVVNGTYVKIDLKTFDVIFPNGFKMIAKSVQEAKQKATDFLKD